MARAVRSRHSIAITLFAWLPAIAIGLAFGRLTHTAWPAPACAAVWLAVLFWTLRRSAREA